MARGKSTKLMAMLPDNYSANWLSRLDKRTKVARAVLARIEAFEADAGGADTLTQARRSLIRHVAWLDAIVDSHELTLAGGKQIDMGAYTQALNTLLGLFRMLGLERRQKRARSLHEHMGSARPVNGAHVSST